MKRLPIVFAALLLALPVSSAAAESENAPSPASSHHLQLHLGVFDLHRTNRGTQFGAEYHATPRWTYLDLRPFGGVLRTRKQSHFVYAGLMRESRFTAAKTGFYLRIELAVGYYRHGGRSDTDLGAPVQFRTGAGLSYQFQDATRVGLSFLHMSNASMSRTNPGTEMISLTYGIPLP